MNKEQARLACVGRVARTLGHRSVRRTTGGVVSCVQSINGRSFVAIQPHASAVTSEKQAGCCVMSSVGGPQAYAAWDYVPQ
uniref:Uncharacterized protein n=1 Tax=Mesocestoides corti TaxID=53468 RepID=A0A5K3FV28_MESCO